MESRDPSPRSFLPGAVAGGLILIAIGAGMLLDLSGTIHIQGEHLVAPLVLIVLGAVMTLEGGAGHSDRDSSAADDARRRRRRNPMGGLWLIGIGAWMFISQNRLWGLSFETSWPLFLVVMGFLMVVRGWR